MKLPSIPPPKKKNVAKICLKKKGKSSEIKKRNLAESASNWWNCFLVLLIDFHQSCNKSASPFCPSFLIYSMRVWIAHWWITFLCNRSSASLPGSRRFPSAHHFHFFTFYFIFLLFSWGGRVSGCFYTGYKLFNAMSFIIDRLFFLLFVVMISPCTD